MLLTVYTVAVQPVFTSNVWGWSLKDDVTGPFCQGFYEHDGEISESQSETRGQRCTSEWLRYNAETELDKYESVYETDC